MRDEDERYVEIVPSERQFRQQCLEFYAFFHFTINTYTNKEWGDGTERPEIFNPVSMDANQWVRAVKGAGMKGAILTCKHHDGFCLWPSKYTKHSVELSPYKNGKGDIVKEVSDACRKEGLKFGIYLSPWDRNQTVYGRGKEYNDYFVNQLEELLTQYGDVFSVWFDGACGEGSNGKKQIYDWERYYNTIRQYQPGACITVCGPDIRWCGNEAGITRPSEWSVIPQYLSKTELIQESSQKEDDVEFRQQAISSSDLDLGSRMMLEKADDIIWYPAEVNTSLRPGWFYHPEEDDKVRSLEELLTIYYGSVGGNSTFLLNVPPTPEGLIHKNDVMKLYELGQYLKQKFMFNLVPEAMLSTEYEDGIHTIETVRKDDYQEYFKTSDGQKTVDISINFIKQEKVSAVVLKENIKFSQRIEHFEVWVGASQTIQKVYEGTVVGYKKIILIDAIECNHILIRILDSRICPTLSFVGAYRENEREK